MYTQASCVLKGAAIMPSLLELVVLVSLLPTVAAEVPGQCKDPKVSCRFKGSDCGWHNARELKWKRMRDRNHGFMQLDMKGGDPGHYGILKSLYPEIASPEQPCQLNIRYCFEGQGDLLLSVMVQAEKGGSCKTGHADRAGKKKKRTNGNKGRNNRSRRKHGKKGRNQTRGNRSTAGSEEDEDDDEECDRHCESLWNTTEGGDCGNNNYSKALILVPCSKHKYKILLVGKLLTTTDRRARPVPSGQEGKIRVAHVQYAVSDCPTSPPLSSSSSPGSSTHPVPTSPPPYHGRRLKTLRIIALVLAGVVVVLVIVIIVICRCRRKDRKVLLVRSIDGYGGTGLTNPSHTVYYANDGKPSTMRRETTTGNTGSTGDLPSPDTGPDPNTGRKPRRNVRFNDEAQEDYNHLILTNSSAVPGPPAPPGHYDLPTHNRSQGQPPDDVIACGYESVDEVRTLMKSSASLSYDACSSSDVREDA